MKKIKGKKSPTVVTVPKKYKKTNPDARIWGISSAMRLCPLTEGQKNMKELKYFKAWNGYFRGPLRLCMSVTHIALAFNKQNLFRSIQEKSWLSLSNTIYLHFWCFILIQIGSFPWQPKSFQNGSKWIKSFLSPFHIYYPSSFNTSMCCHFITSFSGDISFLFDAMDNSKYCEINLFISFLGGIWQRF